MTLHTNTIIILLSSLVILSYIFTIISRKTQIPSVLLLIGVGIGVKYLTASYGIPAQDVNKLVKILGTVGLIMIVLEAALDLKLGRNKVKLIRDSFSSGLFIFLFSSLSIGVLIMTWLGESFENAFIYAVPLSIISSAIVIPSTSHLQEEKKEFIIYESSFSDIIGILVFNYMLMKNVMSFEAFGTFSLRVLMAVLISVVASLVLVYILAKIQVALKFFLVFAILSLIYASGELIHLPSLLIVLVFGMILNNSSLALPERAKMFIPTQNLDAVLNTLKSITAETSFLIRTFFFIVFGYTISLNTLILPEVWKLGTIIVLILLFVRFVYLKIILKSNLFPELFLMPRGLVTILLFYSIPAGKSLASFNEGILFYVVALTSILMMVGLLFFNNKGENYMAESERVI